MQQTLYKPCIGSVYVIVEMVAWVWNWKENKLHLSILTLTYCTQAARSAFWGLSSAYVQWAKDTAHSWNFAL